MIKHAFNSEVDSFRLSVKLAGAWWSVFGRALLGSTVGPPLLQLFRVGLLLSTLLVSSQWWILIDMFAVLIHWWVEVLHEDRTTSMCIWTTTEPRVRLLQRQTDLSPPPPPHTHTPVIYFWAFKGDASVVVYSNSMFIRFLFVFDLLFNLLRVALLPSVGKELSPWLFICAFIFIVLVPFPFGV